jgi:ketosteroid isomerase-like protein
MTTLSLDVADWLRRFSQAVRDQNFVAGRELFANNTVSFGTICFRAETLAELESRQWRMVWPNTSSFDFEYGSAVGSVEGNQAVVLANWTSQTRQPENNPIKRRGRATIVLRRTGSQWQSIHTHFSLTPSDHDPLLRRVSENAAQLH